MQLFKLQSTSILPQLQENRWFTQAQYWHRLPPLNIPNSQTALARMCSRKELFLYNRLEFSYYFLCSILGKYGTYKNNEQLPFSASLSEKVTNIKIYAIWNSRREDVFSGQISWGFGLGLTHVILEPPQITTSNNTSSAAFLVFLELDPLASLCSLQSPCMFLCRCRVFLLWESCRRTARYTRSRSRCHTTTCWSWSSLESTAGSLRFAQRQPQIWFLCNLECSLGWVRRLGVQWVRGLGSSLGRCTRMPL